MSLLHLEWVTKIILPGGKERENQNRHSNSSKTKDSVSSPWPQHKGQKSRITNSAWWIRENPKATPKWMRSQVSWWLVDLILALHDGACPDRENPKLDEFGRKKREKHNTQCEICSEGGTLICCYSCNIVYHRKCTQSLAPEFRFPARLCSFIDSMWRQMILPLLFSGKKTILPPGNVHRASMKRPS